MSNPEDDLTEDQIQRMMKAVLNIGKKPASIPVESRTASSRPRSFRNVPYEPVAKPKRSMKKGVHFEDVLAGGGKCHVVKIDDGKRTRLMTCQSQEEAWAEIRRLEADLK